MNESSTLKLSGLVVVWNMKGHIVVISKTSSVLVVDVRKLYITEKWNT